MILGLTYYQTAVYFLIYAFAGWVIEVAFHALVTGKVINRGFLAGPVCPVYGFGMLGILMALYECDTVYGVGSDNIWVTFFVGALVCTLIELLAGVLLKLFFHARWWDYSNERFNFHGYICLKFSVFWGVGVVFAVNGIHAFVEKGVSLMPESVGLWLMAACFAILLTDFVITVLCVIGVNRRMQELDRLRADLRIVSDDLSEVIAESTFEVQKHAEKIQNAAQAQKEITEHNIAEIRDDIRAEKEKLHQKRIRQLQSELAARSRTLERLFMAFPDLYSVDHDTLLKSVRKSYEERMK